MNSNINKSNQNNYIDKLQKPVESGNLSLFILNSFLDYTHQGVIAMLLQNQQNQQDKKLFPGQETGFIRILIKRRNIEGGVQLRFDLFPNDTNDNFTAVPRHQDEQQSPRPRRRSNRASTHQESVQLSFDLFPDEPNDN